MTSHEPPLGVNVADDQLMELLLQQSLILVGENRTLFEQKPVEVDEKDMIRIIGEKLDELRVGLHNNRAKVLENENFHDGIRSPRKLGTQTGLPPRVSYLGQPLPTSRERASSSGLPAGEDSFSLFSHRDRSATCSADFASSFEPPGYEGSLFVEYRVPCWKCEYCSEGVGWSETDPCSCCGRYLSESMMPVTVGRVVGDSPFSQVPSMLIPRPGDWICGCCGNLNWEWRSQCNRCHSYRTNSSFELVDLPQSLLQSGGDTDNTDVVPLVKHRLRKRLSTHPAGIFKDRDWVCVGCGNINWDWRAKCHQCRSDKPVVIDLRESAFSAMTAANFSANWRQIGSSYFSIHTVYEHSGFSDTSSTILSPSAIVAVCPLGGPVCAIVGKKLHVYSSSFDRLVGPLELNFLTALIVGVWWSLDPAPVINIVLSDGAYKRYALMPSDELLGALAEELFLSGPVTSFSKDPIVALSVSSSDGSLVGTHCVLLTQSLKFYEFGHANGTLNLFASLPVGVGVVCFCLIGKDLVVVALDNSQVVVVNKMSTELHVLYSAPPKQVVQLLSLSFSEKFMALYTSGGQVVVFGVLDLKKTFSNNSEETQFSPVSSSTIEIGVSPSQLAWVGDDAVALYFSSKSRNVVFVGGLAGGEWSPYEYDSKIILVSDFGRCIVLSANKFQLVQRVHHSLVSVFLKNAAVAIISNDELEPAATTLPPSDRLVFGYRKFLDNDIISESTIRSIKPQLEKAVHACIEAAAMLLPSSEDCSETILFLLKASLFGRQFLDNPVACANFYVTCAALIRVCADANRRGIPVSVPQLMGGMDLSILPHMLIARGQYLQGLKIAQWLGIPDREIASSKSCSVYQSAFSTFSMHLISQSDNLTDAELCELIVNHGGIFNKPGSIGPVAIYAKKRRPKLTKLLLDHELLIPAKVNLQLQLGYAGEAFESAVASGQVDLIYRCFDKLDREDKDSLRGCLLKFSDNGGLNVTSLLMQRLVSENRIDEVNKYFHGITPMSSLLHATSKDGAKNIADVAEWYQFSAERFAEDSGKHYFSGVAAAVLADHSQLLRSQAELEKTAAARGWPRGPHRFVNQPLDETLEKLILIGETADTLRIKRKVSEGKFWDLKARALCLADRFDELAQLPPPPAADCAGFKLVVDMLIKRNKTEIAAKYIPKLKVKKQVELYQQLGLRDEALRASMTASSGSSVVGGLLGKLTGGFMGLGHK